MDIHQFFLGNAFDAYTFFGAHVQKDGSVCFRTLAPNAEKVSLIYEGNDWKEIPMEKTHPGGVYTCIVPDAIPGMMYKYRIYSEHFADVEFIDHCDPYGFGMELRPGTASIIRDTDSYHFQDSEWLSQRGGHLEKPVNIYEVHLGSWKTNPNDPNGWYRYEELAPLLIAYAKKNGYNYIECMPLSEHPADCSWGYQNTGFYSPTARYGDMDGLKKFVDLCHRSGIGVIMDFVPVHFAVDGYGLARYDGTALYEYPDDNSDNYSEWGSCNFIHARGEVCSFLQSCANYWISEFHFDGIRMDAVSRLIYWGGDPGRGENEASLNFLKRMNQGLHQLHPDAMLIAAAAQPDGVCCQHHIFQYITAVFDRCELGRIGKHQNDGWCIIKRIMVNLLCCFRQLHQLLHPFFALDNNRLCRLLIHSAGGILPRSQNGFQCIFGNLFCLIAANASSCQNGIHSVIV